MKPLKIAELNPREQGYGIFQMNNLDVVAAHNMEEAISWYLEDSSYRRDELTPKELELDFFLNYVDTPESNIRSVTYRELIREAVRDGIAFPCIIATYEW